MLYTEQNVRDNLRNREGKRVFYLGKEDRLTPGARDFLTRERIPILSAMEARREEQKILGGGYVREKPEHMTHLNGDVLVSKLHPRIRFRGCMDTLAAEIMLCQLAAAPVRRELGEILTQVRYLVRCDVLEEPVPEGKLCGLTEAETREQSHRPQDVYGQPHFMPEYTDGEAILRLNRARCAAREAELLAMAAFSDPDGVPTRVDILKALNRMSSILYILMIRLKKEG